MDEHRIKSAVNTMNNWLARRKVKGKHPNADEIWARIKTNWPTMSEEESEAVFQRMKG